MSPTDKSPHEAFMEAAAVETLAAVLYRQRAGGGHFGFNSPLTSDRDRASYRAEARRLINQNMETRHDG